MRFILALACLASSMASAALPATNDTHPFGVRDLVAFDRLAEPRVSPNGRQIVFTVSSLDLEANKRRSDLWVVGTDGAGLRPLLRSDDSESNGTWSPDGRTIYFLSNRGGSSQVWKIAVDGGDAKPVTSLPLDVGSFRALARRNEAGTFDGGLPRDHAGRDQEAHGRRCRRQGHRQDLRQALLPTLGHVGRRPALARLRRAAVGRGPDRRHEGHGCRLAVEAVRRERGVRLHAGRQGDRLRRTRRGPRGGMVDELRPVRRPGRREHRAAQSHGGEQGMGCVPGVLARRQDARVRGHEAPGLRGGPLPHRAARMAGWNRSRVDRGMGPLARRAHVVAGRQGDIRHGRRHREPCAVRHRRRDRKGAHDRRQGACRSTAGRRATASCTCSIR